MSKTIDKIAEIISKYAVYSNSQVFGQNLFKPSYISGLGKKMVENDGITPLSIQNFDATNSELTSIGYGIGRAIEGSNTLLIVKQQDFLFLGIDQFINSTLNCVEEDGLKGKFKIICLVSDMPKEGTQAYSNNIALFSNLSPSLEVNYCFNSQIFEKVLAESKSKISICFLSSEYIYSSSILENIKNNSYFDKFFDFGSGDNLNIIVGFIPEKKLKPLFKQRIIYPFDMTNLDWIDLLSAIKEKDKIKNINLHESSSSCFNFSENIAWEIKKNFKDQNIFITSYRENKINQFSLRKQESK